MYLPSCCGGNTYYDKLLQKIHMYSTADYNNRFELYPLSRINVSQLWRHLGQTFIDDFINARCRGSQKWLAVPSFDLGEHPCYPGSVIIVNKMSLSKFIRRKPRRGYFAGTLADFYPTDRNLRLATTPMAIPTKTDLEDGHRIYRAKGNNRAVVITASIGDMLEISDDFNVKDTFIDISNFEYTGFEHSTCYVVTKVIQSQKLTLDMTQDGMVYYECVHEGPVPICFQVARVKVLNSSTDSTGSLKSIKPVTGNVPFEMRGRRNWAAFFGSFVPNQSWMGYSSGDFSTTSQWREPVVSQSMRPNFLRNLDLKIAVAKIRFINEKQYRQVVQWIEEIRREVAEARREERCKRGVMKIDDAISHDKELIKEEEASTSTTSDGDAHQVEQGGDAIEAAEQSFQ